MKLETEKTKVFTRGNENIRILKDDAWQKSDYVHKTRLYYPRNC